MHNIVFLINILNPVVKLILSVGFTKGTLFFADLRILPNFTPSVTCRMARLTVRMVRNLEPLIK